MTKAEAIEFFGTGAALATALGVTRSAISQWAEIPIDKQCQIEILTSGDLEADRDKLNKPAPIEERAA